MKLGIDLRCLPVDGSPGAGIEHASRELFEEITRQLEDSPHQLYAFLRSHDEGSQACGSVEGEPEILHSVQENERVKRVKIIIVRNARGLIRAAQSNKIEAMIFPTGSIPFSWPVSIKAFPWIHDIAIFHHPEWFTQPWWQRWFTTWQFKRGLQMTEHLFTVSQATKQELMDEYQFRLTRQDITVTGQGIERTTQRWNPNQTSPYALILGTVEPRKNIPFILKLWPKVQARLGKQVRLAVVGRSGWGQVPIPAEPWIDRQSAVSDQAREQWLTGASMVLLPSLHEGFGRVALEGLAVGAPVIVSDRGALPEVVGSAGAVLPLTDPEAWINEIVQRFSQINPKEISIRQQQAERFSWPQTAQTMLAKILPQ